MNEKYCFSVNTFQFFTVISVNFGSHIKLLEYSAWVIWTILQ